MPFKKINTDSSWTLKMCQSPEHNPPSMISLPAGTYKWTCPHCGNKQRVYVPGVRYDAG